MADYYIRTRNDIWNTMLNRGKSSANAVPGTVSSMTAHGVLPHYGGHATASLTPAIANRTSSPKDTTIKATESNDARPSLLAAEKRGENRHPAEVGLGDSFRGPSC
jgi:hypothetical protein